MRYSFYYRLLEVLLKEIVPATRISVAKGNKIFGAAIINRFDLSTICIGTNNEIKNPLLHGEISAINNLFDKFNSSKINTKDFIFISSHEPCSLCLSAITWSGFNEIYFYFPYSETKNNFKIPHDLKILSEIFKIKNGKYNKKNEFWKIYSIVNEIKRFKKEEKKSLNLKIKKIDKLYTDLSKEYQKNKKKNNIPFY